MKSGHRSFSPLTLLQHVEFDPAHTFFPTCSDFWLDFAPVVRMACERKFLESEATTGFFLLLGKQGNKAVLDWIMKEGLIPSRYECPKCKKDMRLVERKGTIDGFEWRCRVQSKENPHFVCRSSNTRAIGDGSRNFEPRSGNEDDTLADTYFPHHINGRTMGLVLFYIVGLQWP
ncbi:uncharacterized protein TNCV_4354391 [Trichonephila clavipes]|nr:uncharacterized protein TNCV_4354391 [Trichonephila clavipes]